MLKPNFIPMLFVVCIAACSNDKAETPKTTDADTSTAKPAPGPELPSYVLYKDWETGKPENAELVLNVYKAWDSDSPADMANYFADSAAYDFPDGTRASTTNTTVESKFRQWRNAYKETTNIPFSLISLYNKDRDQEWVIAWTWNKWTYTDGKKDSMLFCDNWRIKGGKIDYLTSLQNRASKQLTKKLETVVSK